MKKIFYFYVLICLNDYIYNVKNKCYEFSCEECSSIDFGKCTKCRENFKLIDGTCPCPETNCALCTTGLIASHSCALCKYGYYNNNNDCFCDIENCLQCGENGCLKCNIGYFYNINSEKCELITCSDSNCKLCYSNELNKCYECKTGYKLENGNCNNQYEPAPCNNENYYELSSYCYEKCEGLDCSVNIQNKYNRYNCSNNNCLFCENNVLYPYSNCTNSEMCNIDGCKICKTNSICFKCNVGYRNENGNCLKCIKGCSICTNDYTCEYCLSGYQLTSDKICVLTNVFDYNNNIYILKKKELLKNMYPDEYEYDNESIELYNQCDKNCLKCNDNNGECSQCKDDYNLSGNKCIKCYSERCSECSDASENSCSKCENGFHLIDGRCWNINNDCNNLISNCILCNGSDKCYSCSDNYALDKNKTKCEKIRNYWIILYIFLGLLLIGIIVLNVICQRKRILRLNREEEERRRAQRERELNNIENNHNSERLSLNDRKKKFEREFERLPGNDDNQIRNESVSSSTDGRKCYICYKKDEIAKSFKCGCSFKVCKECYVQSKLRSNKCPQCRSII